jgi:hypothetical protein
MNTFLCGDIARLESNKATVSDLAAVEDVVNGYHAEFDVLLERGGVPGQGAIRIVMDPQCGLPVVADCETLDAMADERGLDPDDEEKYWESLDELMDEFGDEALADLLLEIAPYLLTPLTVQALAYYHGDSEIRSKVWHVAPGADRVEVNVFGGEG